ncbi:F-box/kelch-repeat protein At1g57790 [Linum perenne]
MSCRRWEDLLPEILSLILSNLHGKDVPIFRSVCRNWNSVPPPKSKNIHHFSEMIKYPFLLTYRHNSSLILHTPAYNKTYSIRAPFSGLEDAQIHSSNFGWLLLSRRERSRRFFFLQPVTGDIINLPRFNIDPYVPCLNEMSFSAPPTSPNCVVLGVRVMDKISWTRFAFIRRGDSSWRSSNHQYPNKTRLKFNLLPLRLDGSKVNTNLCSFRPIPCAASIMWSSLCSAPVFHNGAFYCLSENKRLGVFDPWKDETSKMWRFLDVNFDSSDVESSTDKAYLMESSRGELILVMVGLRGEFVRMYRFDDDLRLWQGISSLGDQVAFLSPTSSIVLSCKELQVKGLENTIHFPRFDGDCNVFYSLSTGRFHSFKGGYTSDHTSDKELQLNSTWMMPEFRRYSNQQLDWNNDSPEEEDPTIQVDPSYFISGFNFSQPQNYIVDATMSRITASPWIILSHENTNKSEPHRTLVNLVTNVSHSNDSRIEMFRGKEVYGSSNGLVLLVESESAGGDCVLLNTKSMTVEPLPKLKLPTTFRRNCFVIHCETVVMIFGFIKMNNQYEATTILCRVGDKEWTICTGGITVHDVAAYQGKLYGIGWLPESGRYDFIEMELLQHQMHYKVTKVVGIELPKYKHMGQIGAGLYMVESRGELLYFEMMVSDVVIDSFPVVMDVRVSKVDLEGMRTEVVKDLGDRAFFMGVGGGFGCCASESGVERNSIYFVDQANGNVCKCDYGSHRISTVFSTGDHEAKSCKIDGIVMLY